MQPRAAVPPAPPGQTGSGLAAHPKPARPNDLAAAQRTRLRNRRRPLLKEAICERSARELLAQQAGDEHDRAARPLVHHAVLGLSGSVARNDAHDAEWLAVDLSGVVLDEVPVAVVAREVDVLIGV